MADVPPRNLLVSAIALHWLPQILASCLTKSFSIPISNVTLSNGQITRGVKLSVGSPPQSFAFLPQWDLNNTFLYGTNGFCNAIHPGGWSEPGCTSLRGGQYNELSSITRQPANASVHPPDTQPRLQMTYIMDTLAIGPDNNLPNFPLGVALNDLGFEFYHAQMTIGLGPDSTILTTLKSSGKIAARAWSFFWGRTGGSANAQMDGSLVLGGYDKAKITGQRFVERLTPNQPGCPQQMMVSIIDMQLNFPNGTDASIFPEQKASIISACVIPDFPALMTLPLDPYFQKFQALTGTPISQRTRGLNFWSMKYSNGTKPFEGDLTFKLSSGFSVRIPNNQLVVPDVFIDQVTGALSVNPGGPNLVLYPLQASQRDDLPILGRHFFSTAYLHANQDAGNFVLWTANPTNAVDLVAVTEAGAEASSCSSGNSNDFPKDGGSGRVDSSSGGLDGGSSRLAGGAIAGIVVGIIIFIGAAATAFWLWRRQKRKVVNGCTGEEMTVNQFQEGYAEYGKAELQGTDPTNYSNGIGGDAIGVHPMGRYELP